jgi:dihydroorotate dehydrogenase
VLYKQLLRPLLFRLRHGDAESAHERTLALLASAARSRALLGAMRRAFSCASPALARTVFGLRFPNPVGLAAGMDKDGVALPAWAALGFGFVEVGTVTWLPQPGNPRPRLFRLPDRGAIINRMGFNNGGAAALAARLDEAPYLPVPLGISIGKSKATPLERAVEDYTASFRTLFDHAGYFAVNVSSPNTPGLRALQDRAQLSALLAALRRENELQAAERGGRARPILVKIAPDLGEQALCELLEVCAAHGVSGLIATNTTLGRAGLGGTSPTLAAEAGGLSGRPLAPIALAVVRFVARETGGRLPIIGVGGIATPDDARRMLDAGASLLQLYTGLIYEGPGLPGRLNRALAHSG